MLLAVRDIGELFGVLPDWRIRQLCEEGMIENYEPDQIKEIPVIRDGQDEGLKKVISYGVTCYGYDMRLMPKYRVFHNVHGITVDPKNFDERCLIDLEGDHCVIPPNSYMLGTTVERFNIPRDVLALCIGKSTYARCGIIVNMTPAEPEWCGHLTLEISNSCPCPAKVYGNEGIAQMIFLQAIQMCKESYADKKGKYQDQKGIVTAKL